MIHVDDFGDHQGRVGVESLSQKHETGRFRLEHPRGRAPIGFDKHASTIGKLYVPSVVDVAPRHSGSPLDVAPQDRLESHAKVVTVRHLLEDRRS